jgi:DNA ligase 1
MGVTFKPMLSASLDGVDLSTLRYPLMASPKLDGVRCILRDGVAHSRNLKPIRNHFVQRELANSYGLDGELIVGPPTEGLVLNRTQSGVMSYDGEPDFTFWVFDHVGVPSDPFFTRWDRLTHSHPRIKTVPHVVIHDVAGLLQYEQECLSANYEGVMLRDPNGPYKHGRSTLNEGYLMKLKRFTDGEGVVASLEEGTRNDNVLTRDALGRAHRTTHKENLVGNGMVGTIVLEDGMRVAPGTMSHQERRGYWMNQDLIIGKKIHWRAFGYGQKDTPRFPRFYGIVLGD